MSYTFDSLGFYAIFRDLLPIAMIPTSAILVNARCLFFLETRQTIPRRDMSALDGAEGFGRLEHPEQAYIHSPDQAQRKPFPAVDPYSIRTDYSSGLSSRLGSNVVALWTCRTERKTETPLYKQGKSAVFSWPFQSSINL